QDDLGVRRGQLVDSPDSVLPGCSGIENCSRLPAVLNAVDELAVGRLDCQPGFRVEAHGFDNNKVWRRNSESFGNDSGGAQSCSFLQVDLTESLACACNQYCGVHFTGHLFYYCPCVI